jgi:hypothetical protein
MLANWPNIRDLVFYDHIFELHLSLSNQRSLSHFLSHLNVYNDNNNEYDDWHHSSDATVMEMTKDIEVVLGCCQGELMKNKVDCDVLSLCHVTRAVSKEGQRIEERKA